MNINEIKNELRDHMRELILRNDLEKEEYLDYSENTQTINGKVVKYTLHFKSNQVYSTIFKTKLTIENKYGYFFIEFDKNVFNINPLSEEAYRDSMILFKIYIQNFIKKNKLSIEQQKIQTEIYSIHSKIDEQRHDRGKIHYSGLDYEFKKLIRDKNINEILD